MQRTTLVVAMLTNFSSTFAASSLNIAIPNISREFNVSATSVSWIVLAFLLISALLAIPFGRIADMYGRRPFLKFGILLFCVAAFINMFTPNMTVFFICRVIQGVASAMIFSTNTAILVDAYPPEKRGSVMGISVAAVFTGSAVGPVIGGIVTHAFGWRSLFILITAFGVVAFVMAVINLPNLDRDVIKERVNNGSILLYILSLGLFMFGLATLTQNVQSYIIFAAGVVMLVVFVKREIRTDVPVIEVRLFKNSDFSLSNLAALFNYAAVFAVIYLMSIYLQLVRGFTADYAGIIMISQPLVQAALSPASGRLSDKKPPAVIASIGMACCAGALVMFAFLGDQTSVIYIIAGLILTGLGVALFSSPNASMIMGAVENKDYGVASSVMSTSRMVGQVVGMALLTIIVNAVIGSAPLADVAPAKIVYDMQISFPIFAAICFVGILFSLQRGGIRRKVK